MSWPQWWSNTTSIVQENAAAARYFCTTVQATMEPTSIRDFVLEWAARYVMSAPLDWSYMIMNSSAKHKWTEMLNLFPNADFPSFPTGPVCVCSVLRHAQPAMLAYQGQLHSRDEWPWQSRLDLPGRGTHLCRGRHQQINSESHQRHGGGKHTHLHTHTELNGLSEKLIHLCNQARHVIHTWLCRLTAFITHMFRIPSSNS